MLPVMDLDDLYRYARTHHGVVPFRLAHRFDASPPALRRLARAEGWELAGTGAACLPGVPRTEAQAALLAIEHLGGERVLLARRSAALLHGFDVAAPTALELVVPHDRRVTAPPGTEVRSSRTLKATDRTEIDGVPCTTVGRTAVDCAQVLPLGSYRGLVIDGLQRRRLTREGLSAQRRRMPYAPGAWKLDTVLAELGSDDPDSAFELDVRLALRRLGVQPWPAPFPFLAADGRVVHLDIAFPGAWTALEPEGLGAHGTRAQLVKDTRRHNGVMEDWAIARIEFTDFHADPDGVLAPILATIRRRDGARPAATPHPCRCRRCTR